MSPADAVCPVPPQDGVQQHLLQSGDGHGQRDLGAVQSPSLQQGYKDNDIMLETQECVQKKNPLFQMTQLRVCIANSLLAEQVITNCSNIRNNYLLYNYAN